MIKGLLITGFSILHFCICAQDFNAELISYETTIHLDDEKLISNTCVQVQINNRAGEKYAKVSIPYSKLKKISKIEASIKDHRGKLVRNLKRKDISDRSYISDMSLYEDDFLKEFTLKHNSYPYTITYSYQIQESEFIFVDYWIPVLSRQIPTHKASLTATFPQDYQISYSSNLIKKFNIDTIESMLRYSWETAYSDIVKSEEFAPQLNDYLPSVKIVPLDFSYEEAGSFRTWTDLGIWNSKLLHGINELPEKEKERIRATIKGLDEDVEKIRALYHYLQDETRYINVTIETGGLKPYPAAYVAENKYGDCKALSNYFQSVLNEANIKSYYTKVYAGEPIRQIDKEFPSQQFNHIILYIPLEKDTLWLDCTSDAAFDYLGTFTQNREAFVVDGSDSRFIRTPALSAIDVLETRRITVPYERYSDLDVEFQKTYRGDMYELLLELDDNYNKGDKSMILRNYLMEEGFELVDYEINKADRDSTFIQLSYVAGTDRIYEHYGNDILVNNIPFTLPDIEEPEERKLPVQIDYPIYLVDTIVYEIPGGYSLQKKPVPQYVSGSPGEYSLKFVQKDRSIEVIKSLLVHPGTYPVEEYPDFHSFCREVDSMEHKIFITLTK